MSDEEEEEPASGLRPHLPSSHYFRGNSYGDTACGQIFRDHRAGSDDAAITDGNSGGDNHARTKPDIVAYVNVALSFRLLTEGKAGDELVIRSGDEDTGCERDVVADFDPAGDISRPEEATFTDVTAASQRDSLAVAQRDIRRDAGPLTHPHPTAGADMTVNIIVEEPEEMEIRPGVDERTQGSDDF
jgi:hypothetical protein